MYQKAAILSMMSEEEMKKTGEDIIELFRSVSLIKALIMSQPQKMPEMIVLYNGNTHCNVEINSRKLDFWVKRFGGGFELFFI